MENLKTRIVNKFDKYFLVTLSVICVFVYNIFLSNFVSFTFNIKPVNDDKIELFLKDNFNKLYEQSKCSIFHKLKIYTKIIKFLFFLWLNNKEKNKQSKSKSSLNLYMNQKQKLTI